MTYGDVAALAQMGAGCDLWVFNFDFNAPTATRLASPGDYGGGLKQIANLPN